MIAFSLQELSRNSSLSSSLGTKFLRVPRERSYLFSYENKARDCSIRHARAMRSFEIRDSAPGVPSPFLLNRPS